MILAAFFVMGIPVVGQILQEPQSFSSDAVFHAMERAYPSWVKVRQADGISTMAVDGKDFVWASGRILGPEQQDHWQEFAPQPFYPYPRQLPDVGSWSDEQVAAVEGRLAQRRSAAPRRESQFFDTLWGIHDRATADASQKRIRFFGLRVTVHKSLEAPLARIQTKLQAARNGDRTLDAFLKTLVELDGYNWRSIAETQSRSNHAYGAAIDIIPKSYRGKNPYWLWAPQEHPGWYRTAWAQRWEPHIALIQAFEDEGFIWGGKWLLFDTIHFEYRPEILVLNGLR